MTQKALSHFGIPGMHWGQRKVQKYQRKAAKQLQSTKDHQQELIDKADPKKWQDYWESRSQQRYYTSPEKIKVANQKLQNAGKLWKETHTNLMNMSYKDARRAKDTYNEAQKKMMSIAGYQIIL